MARQYLWFKVIFVFGYYNGYTVVQRQIICQVFLEVNWVNHNIYHMINRRLMIMALNVFSIFNLILIISRYCFIIKKKWYTVNIANKKKTPGIFCSGLRRGNAPLLTHTSTVENKIIWIHQTMIMLYLIQTSPLSTFKRTVHLIH